MKVICIYITSMWIRICLTFLNPMVDLPKMTSLEIHTFQNISDILIKLNDRSNAAYAIFTTIYMSDMKFLQEISSIVPKNFQKITERRIESERLYQLFTRNFY